MLVVAVCCASNVTGSAQTPDQTTGPNQTWTATSDLNSNNANPTRTTETHTRNGNRTVDTHSLQRRGSDGQFEPYQDIETEPCK